MEVRDARARASLMFPGTGADGTDPLAHRARQGSKKKSSQVAFTAIMFQCNHYVGLNDLKCGWICSGRRHALDHMTRFRVEVPSPSLSLPNELLCPNRLL